MKTLRPTGGVISPSSTTIRVMIPYQILSSSPDPVVEPATTGQKNGVARITIDRLSIRQPSTRYTRMISTMIMIGVRPLAWSRPRSPAAPRHAT